MKFNIDTGIMTLFKDKTLHVFISILSIDGHQFHMPIATFQQKQTLYI